MSHRDPVPGRARRCTAGPTAEPPVLARRVLRTACRTFGAVPMVARIRRLVREDAVRNKKENR